MKKYCFGVDIGGTTAKVGLFTVEGEKLESWEIPTRKENHGEYILPDVADSLTKKMTEKGISKEEVEGIGIGVPGPVTQDGEVLQCVNLGWGIVQVKNQMESLTGLRTKVGNDANVAALGEMWQGGGKGFDSIVMITLGTGVGGGVILNGEILAGSRGAAGEIGHMTVKYDEPDTCGCGKRGCLEQYTSATGIVKETKRLLAKDDTPSTLRSFDTITAKDVFDAMKAGDEIATKAAEQLGYYLGLACSHVAAVVDPQAFVIGGGVSKAGEVLIDLTKKNYENSVMFALKGKEFLLAKLGNDAGMYGCARMLLGK